ncbi:acyl-CoA synthetase [Rhizobium sp. Root274]|uniref:acetate--CoA ligase family protein n=1 Tax=unclassified Rhizobium TaxID=2613769 RepID=UPI0007160A2A|nr:MULTISPECIES: acetate--CoA ligase family protein [unclassified Rhizobium]KQW31857.1 acyl-CoA synthetase [Rhizobium sp. Root1240]KRD33396.1 acyl-CoA synthetase [Rhizobium sp. Root274]
MTTEARSPLSRLIRPETIAVFGGKEAARVVEQCSKAGYRGAIWPVHPTRETMHGHRCYRSVAELPGAPDASFIGVNRSLSVEILRALSQRGAGGAICYASGFAEAVQELPDGPELQAELVDAAGDMAMLGPNCYGFINMLDDALLWPDQHGMKQVERGVAILTQSSNIALNISMQARGLPIAYLMTAGNQAQTGLSALATAALEDERVTAVALHVESFDDLEALQQLGSRARALGKPVVALKVGKSVAAQRAALSHTASLAGNDRVSSALLKRLGIGRVHSLPEMLETLKLLHVCGPLAANTVSSMSCSGGEASLMADAGIGRSVEFRDLSPQQLPALRETLGAMVTLSNPLDYHTFVWGNRARQAEAFSTVMEGDYGINLVVLDFPRADRCDVSDWTTTIEAFIDAKRRTGAATGVVATLGETMPEAVATRLVAEGVVPFCGIDEALAAIDIAHSIHVAWSSPAPACLSCSPVVDTDVTSLFEDRAKPLLAAYGVTVPYGLIARNPEQAVSVADRLGYPVAVKGIGIAHKSDVGAVRLNIRSASEVLAAATAMGAITERFLVEKMAQKPVAELIVGAFRDPFVGPVLTLGAGGVLVDLIDDSTVLLLPTTDAEIRAAIAGLKVSALIKGYRGGPAGDINALVQLVASVADYVADNATRLEELDLNPVLVLPEGEGVIAVDAFIRTRS